MKRILRADVLCILIVCTIAGTALVLYWFWADGAQYAGKYRSNPARVRSHGLPIYPGAAPSPYGKRDRPSRLYERAGQFRFTTRVPFQTVVRWYQENLTCPPWRWTTLGPAVPGASFDVAEARRLNPDGLSETSVKINVFADRPGTTYIFYRIPMESELYQEHLERLRELTERSRSMQE